MGLIALLLLLVIFLHVSSTTISIPNNKSSINLHNTYHKNGEFTTWSLNCRRCKVHIKTGIGVAKALAPPENSSSEKKTNVGAVVGFTFLLVFIIVFTFLCIYRSRRTVSQGIAIRRVQQPVIVQQPVQVQVQEVVEGAVKHGHAQGNEEEKGRGKERNKRQEPKKEYDKVVIPKKRSREGNEQPLQDEDVGRKYKRGKEDVGGQNGKEKQGHGIEQGNSLGLPNKYPYKYLKKVTNNFDVKNKIGGGGFGNVYRGTLANGTMVAVKCLKYGGMIDDFKNEVEALGRADNCNLVKLIGYCDDGITRILVYECMRNGSLDKWIFHAKCRRTLAWSEMKNIIQGIAQGLVYLHEKCEKKILHRDLKPHNVVLDENKNAKLCDFGLAKLLNKDQSSTSTAWAGTPGYMAPEVMKNKRITDKVDVYSFGVVVLEVVFGKRYHNLVSSDQHNNTEEVKVHDLIKNLSEEMRRNGEEIVKFGKLAMRCLREKPEERPTMSIILAAIQALEAKFKAAKATRK